MQILVKTIYADEEAAVESNDDIQGLARDACEECIQILKEPEKSQAKPAIKILCTFMSTTRASSSVLFPFNFLCQYTSSLCCPVHDLTGCATPCSIIP